MPLLQCREIIELWKDLTRGRHIVCVHAGERRFFAELVERAHTGFRAFPAFGQTFVIQADLGCIVAAEFFMLTTARVRRFVAHQTALTFVAEFTGVATDCAASRTFGAIDLAIALVANIAGITA